MVVKINRPTEPNKGPGNISYTHETFMCDRLSLRVHRERDHLIHDTRQLVIHIEKIMKLDPYSKPFKQTKNSDNKRFKHGRQN